jgi:hypothetical protein
MDIRREAAFSFRHYFGLNSEFKGPRSERKRPAQKTPCEFFRDGANSAHSGPNVGSQPVGFF